MSALDPSISRKADARRYILDSVRSEHPYVVGGTPDLPVKLNQNENPLDLPEPLKEQLLEAFRQIPFNRYPAEHPDRLAGALARRHGISPEGVLVGNGSNELSYLLGLCVLREGTSVVMPRPMFSLYEKVARLYAASITAVPPRDDLSFDAKALAAAVERIQPSLTILTTPNNPTGTALRFDEVAQIVDAAEGIVLVDEAYVEFNDERPALDLLSDHPNLLVMRTFSKAMGLAGLRLGYLMGQPELIVELKKARLPFVVDALAETTALVLLEHEELLRERASELIRSRTELESALMEMEGMKVVPSKANFVIFAAPLEPSEVMARLAGAGVLVRDVSGYPELRGFLRVNAGTPHENRVFLAALKNALSG